MCVSAHVHFGGWIRGTVSTTIILWLVSTEKYRAILVFLMSQLLLYEVHRT